MDPLATQTIDRDRGLGTAYERWCFYQLVEKWALEYGVESALEGPVDGMAGISGVHLVGLARQGIHVASASTTPEKVSLAREVYDTALAVAPVDLRLVVDPMDAADQLPRADMVIAYHSLHLVDDWRDYLRALAKLARKVLVVTVCNPDNWGVALVRTARRLRGQRGVDVPRTWCTEALAPELWSLGRVRDHVYFDAPWWPDLQVAPRAIAARSRAATGFAAARQGAVYRRRGEREARRPLRLRSRALALLRRRRMGRRALPALLRHPGFDGTPTRWIPRLAHLHAFVVDMRPRTPQARRRLAPAP